MMLWHSAAAKLVLDGPPRLQFAYDKDVFTEDDLVGIARLRLNRVRAVPGETLKVHAWVKYRGRRAGCIHFKLVYQPPAYQLENAAGAGTIELELLEAHGLRDPDSVVRPLTEINNAGDCHSFCYAM